MCDLSNNISFLLKIALGQGKSILGICSMKNQIEHFLNNFHKSRKKNIFEVSEFGLKKKNNKNPYPVCQFHTAGNCTTAFSETASLHSLPEAIVIEIGKKKL